jgi:cytochrome c2
MRYLKISAAMIAVLAVVLVRPAVAIPQFQKVFFAEYIDDHGNPEFAETVKTEVKCFLCHQGKKKKTHRNAYGQQLSELLDKKKDKKDVEKISAALKTVGDMPSNPEDPNSKTYAERIAAGRLPAADNLEDLKVEPEDDDKK